MELFRAGFLGFSMGSTGEHDRKRRHFSSISPTAATAKKQPFLPISEDKKVRPLCCCDAFGCPHIHLFL